MFCRTCRGPAQPGLARCYQCGLAASQAGGLLADTVAPIGYAVRGGPLAADLRRYKSDRPEAALAGARLAELLAAFLRDHAVSVWRAAGMDAGPSAMAVVPSGQGRPGRHPLLGLVGGCVDLPLIRLSITPGAVPARGITAGWLQADRPVTGADVLVVDDTWVSGGSAQSAAVALKLAGARRVAIVVLGRHVNPGDPRSAAFLAAVGAARLARLNWIARAGPAHYGRPVRDDGEIRPEREADTEAVREVHTLAFADDGRVAALVGDLRVAAAPVAALSFVATAADRVAGHVMLSASRLDAPARLLDVYVLSPLGVLPGFQRRGIGSALIREALAAAARQAMPLVFLEGSPAYYGSRGFERADAVGFRAPSLRIPPPAFQVARLAGYQSWMTGTLVYSETFWAHDCVGLRPPA